MRGRAGQRAAPCSRSHATSSQDGGADCIHCRRRRCPAHPQVRPGQIGKRDYLTLDKLESEYTQSDSSTCAPRAGSGRVRGTSPAVRGRPGEERGLWSETETEKTLRRCTCGLT